MHLRRFYRNMTLPHLKILFYNSVPLQQIRGKKKKVSFLTDNLRSRAIQRFSLGTCSQDSVMLELVDVA